MATHHIVVPVGPNIAKNASLVNGKNIHIIKVISSNPISMLVNAFIVVGFEVVEVFIV